IPIANGDGEADQLPAPWSDDDIGAVGASGSAAYAAETASFTLSGAGADVWGAADALHFAYQPIAGDVRIVARVASVDNVNAWTKAGVMIRSSLAAGSAQAFMLVSPGKGLAFQRRTSSGGASVNTAGAVATAPYFVRLDRVGSTISAYQSADGAAWKLVGTATMTMGAPVLVGLGVSSHVAATLASATFDHVAVTAIAPPPPPAPALPDGWSQQDIGAVGVAGSGGFDQATMVFTVKGAGADVWGTADALHYVYRPLSGDGRIVARVATVQNVNAWTKAGVMIRSSLAANAAQAFMLVSPGKGLAFQRRLTTGATSVSTSGPLAAAPYWVALERAGSTITAYVSTDGSAWTLVGSDTIAMAADVYVGVAVSSHTTAAAAAATFDGVALTTPNGTP
ncbi:MAG TPA: hypothetical protein VNG89_12705, partial [Vicinamibacterales bacterium]|nr:hypothetical protein [Vicinamibacterales bacterium]